MSLPPDQALPPGLHILSLDDSAVAQKSLKCVLEAELPDAAVATYGKGIEDVDAFMRAALARGDIIIVDQHVDFPGHRVRGTSIVAELMARGYAGFACIRSGDAEEADVAKSKASGAHWHVGKEVPIRTMLQELGREYHRFLQRSSLEEGPFAPDTGPQAVASSSSMPADGSGAGSSSSPSQARRSKSVGSQPPQAVGGQRHGAAPICADLRARRGYVSDDTKVLVGWGGMPNQEAVMTQ